MKKLFIFLLIFSFLFSFSQVDWYKNYIKSDSAISNYQKYQTAKSITEKIKFIDKAIKLEPNNFFLYSRKSQLYYNDNATYQKSIIELTRKFPNEGEAFYTLGFYQEDQGEIESANQNYEIALTKFADDNILSDYNMQPFYKMMTLLLLKRKNDAKIYVDGFPEGKNKDAYVLYHNVLSNIERNKLHDFIKNELK